jgi:hypothetical protein
MAVSSIGAFNTNGLDQTIASSGTPNITATDPVANHTYSCELQTGDDIDLPGGSTAGATRVFNWYAKVSDVTPSDEIPLAQFYDDVATLVCSIVLKTDGDIDLRNRLGTSETSFTPSITAGVWFHIEMRIDGLTASSLLRGQVNGNGATNVSSDLNTGGSYVDFTRLSGPDSGSDVHTVGPYVTQTTGVLFTSGDNFEVFPYRSSLASATPDDGDNLEGTSEQWVNVQEIPWDAADEGTYNNSAARQGGVRTDDVGGSEGTGGPNTDTRISETANILAAQGSIRARRGNGGSTTHTFYYGNDSSWPTDWTSLDSDTISLSSSFAVFQFVTSATLAPDADEYGAIGFGKSSGGREIYVADMLFEVLHKVPPPTPSFPPVDIVKNAYQHMMVR